MSVSCSFSSSFTLTLTSSLLSTMFVLLVAIGMAIIHIDVTYTNAAGVTGPESYPNRYRGNSEKHIVVIGTGPTGLGAAWRLYELGYTNWTLVEATTLSGGLAKSQTDANGFTWDHGVHVLFSHYEYFDSMLDYVLPETEWFHHSRYSPAWMRQRFVDYPVQNNVWQLPKQDTLTCLAGLSEAARLRGSRPPPKNFDEWVVQGFGEGLADIFMRPYNFKVWAHPTPELNVQWVGERVATIDINVILKHMIYELPDRQWGPNARFRYPARGSGQIWQSLFSLLPRSHVALGKRVVAVETSDPNHKRLVFEDKTALKYDATLSTIPIDILVTQMVDQPEIQKMAEFGFKHQTVNLVGVGIEGPVPPHLNATYWVYFPEEDFVFYRLTVLSNFSPYMVPKPGEQYSILVEVSESKYRKVNHETLVDDVIKGLILSRFVSPTANIIDRWQERFEYGYPVPYVGRDEHVHTADEALRKHGIWSRGRFGAWKYEVANQDHSFMLGVEAIDNILFGTEEVTYHKPDVVNAGKGRGRRVNPPNKKHKEHAKGMKAEALDVSSAPQFYTVDASLMHQVSSRVAPVYIPAAVTEQAHSTETHVNNNNDHDHTREQAQSFPRMDDDDDNIIQHQSESKSKSKSVPVSVSDPVSVSVSSSPSFSTSTSTSSLSLSVLSSYRLLSVCVICALGYLVILRMKAIKVASHEKQRTPIQTQTQKITRDNNTYIKHTRQDTHIEDNSA